mmetsp:Transcript_36915/g.48522  ORF Transcript_36915/g.48522 Transcript_36915/m.48522 type:complete len:110 (+) Transcript_36915:945-1274(+)
MKKQEEHQNIQQTENFTATMNHEMRTPILTIILIIKQVIIMLMQDPPSKAELEKCAEFCKLMLNHLEFVRSFVDDMLDLRMLKNGAFDLQKGPFDVMSTISEIRQLFLP